LRIRRPCLTRVASPRPPSPSPRLDTGIRPPALAPYAPLVGGHGMPRRVRPRRHGRSRRQRHRHEGWNQPGLHMR
jgi:hypothetical protein